MAEPAEILGGPRLAAPRDRQPRRLRRLARHRRRLRVVDPGEDAVARRHRDLQPVRRAGGDGAGLRHQLGQRRVGGRARGDADLPAGRRDAECPGAQPGMGQDDEPVRVPGKAAAGQRGQRGHRTRDGGAGRDAGLGRAGMSLRSGRRDPQPDRGRAGQPDGDVRRAARHVRLVVRREGPVRRERGEARVLAEGDGSRSRPPPPAGTSRRRGPAPAGRARAGARRRASSPCARHARRDAPRPVPRSAIRAAPSPGSAERRACSAAAPSDPARRNPARPRPRGRRAPRRPPPRPRPAPPRSAPRSPAPRPRPPAGGAASGAAPTGPPGPRSSNRAWAGGRPETVRPSRVLDLTRRRADARPAGKPEEAPCS